MGVHHLAQGARSSTSSRGSASSPPTSTYVGISHYHDDHTGQAADFPGATLLIGSGDWEAVKKRPETAARFKPWIDGGAKVEPVSGDKDVFGDQSVVVLAMPGHTPGPQGAAGAAQERAGAAERRPLSCHRAGREPRRAELQHQPRRHAGLVRPLPGDRAGICAPRSSSSTSRPMSPSCRRFRRRRNRLSSPRLDPGPPSRAQKVDPGSSPDDAEEMKCALCPRARRPRHAPAHRAPRSRRRARRIARPGARGGDQLSRRADHRGQISVAPAAAVRAGRRDRRRGRGGRRGGRGLEGRRPADRGAGLWRAGREDRHPRQERRSRFRRAAASSTARRCC